MCWAVIAASCGWMETEGGNSSKRILWRLKRWQVIKASPFHIYSIGAFPKFRLSHNPQCMLPQCSEESWVGGILALASYCCPWAVLMNSGGGWIPTWAAPSYIYRENNGPRTGTLMTINHCEKFSSPNSSSSCPFLLLCLPAFLLMNLSSSFEPHVFLCFFIFLPLSLSLLTQELMHWVVWKKIQRSPDKLLLSICLLSVFRCAFWRQMTSCWGKWCQQRNQILWPWKSLMGTSLWLLCHYSRVAFITLGFRPARAAGNFRLSNTPVHLFLFFSMSC